eukprot:scaffold6.g2545.t1
MAQMASRLSSSLLRPAGLGKVVDKGVRLADHFHKELVDDIFASALKKQTGVSLKYMLDFGSKPIERQLILSAQFLHNELPVRLAHRVAELENLPYGLSARPHVRDWYVESFKDLRSFPKFTKLLGHIYRRHKNVVPVMAMGVAELKRELASTIGLNDLPDIHQFLDGFYLSRIGIRMLIGQHIALHEPQRENHIGLIDTRCSPVNGSAPDVSIYGEQSFTFPYVSDEGGGIPRSGLPRIWTYLYTTAKSPLDEMEAEGGAEGSDGPAVLAGYGYGLPISRLYARYFGGDLQILSMECYGTDAYLHLNRLGNVQEPLP